MINFLKIVAFTAIVLIANSVHSAPLLEHYSISSSDLIDGKIKVSSNPESFTALFSIVRGVNSTGGYENVNIRVRVLVVSPDHYDPLVISDVKSITTGNFAGQYYYDGTITCSLPMNYSRGKVYLQMSYEYNPGQYTTYQSSSIYFNTEPLFTIQSMGFSITGIKNFNSSYYLVEDDVLIEKSSLNNNQPNLVSSIYDHNINISTDESVWSNPNLYNGIRQALLVWNKLSGSNIKLNLINTTSGYYNANPRVDIEIKSDASQLPTTTAMVAAYPNGSGDPGKLILVNSDFIQNYQQATWNFIHAIGHALGLKHAISNAGSIMNKGNFLANYSNNLNFDFPTSYDENTIVALYPIDPSSTISPVISGYNSVFSSSYRSVENGISYNWEVSGINGTNYYYEEQGGSQLTDLFLANGNYKIECTISNGKYLQSVTSKEVVIQ